MSHLLDIVLHLDVHLLRMVAEYGVWIYAILFAIIFSETGFVVTPFLPGDSLLFVAGAIAAGGELNVHLLVFLLVVAAVLGQVARREGNPLHGQRSRPSASRIRFACSRSRSSW